jgi:diguanylate cyclase (GGDEF)-like protein
VFVSINTASKKGDVGMFNPLSTAAIAIANPSLQNTAAILLVTEIRAEASAVATILQAGNHHVAISQTPGAAAIELASRKFALIICSVANTNEAQLKGVAAMRSHPLNAETPIILLTPKGSNYAEAMRILGTGVVDCVEQPIDDFVLRAKVIMFMDMYRSKQRLRDVEMQGSGIVTDSLTGLPNRVLFMDRADQAMRQAARGGGRVAVAMMDLEQINDVKDTLGPHTSDELLRQIALRLTGALRRSDTVARIGNTAFATILACDTRDGVETVTARLHRVMTDPFLVGGHRLTLGGGIGVAMFPEHGRDVAILVDRANAVMVIAKQSSMGHLFYDPIDHSQSDNNADSAEMNAEELFRITAA